MNMGDNVASATLQVSGKVVEIGGQLASKTIDILAKLFDYLLQKKKQESMEKSMKSRDLTDLKPGAVSQKSLKQNALRTGDQLVFSQQGLTKADKAYITKKAKQLGIPVAFTQASGKDNIYAQVRKSDLPVFQQICTDMMKDKLAERPQTLGNFKINNWEMQFLTNELNNYDLSASFGVTRDGEHFCLYEKSDEKAIMIARGEFRRKCTEIENDLSFSKSEDGFYTIKSESTGEVISFDEIPTQDELSAQMQQKFGYDENKAQIACAKFSEQHLNAEERKAFATDDPQRQFSNISGYISVEGEDVRCKEYTCWRVTPKHDEIPRIVFRDEEGKFAVLEPDKQSAHKIQKILREELGIEDAATLKALTDKAQKVSDSFITEQNMSIDRVFLADEKRHIVKAVDAKTPFDARDWQHPDHFEEHLGRWHDYILDPDPKKMTEYGKVQSISELHTKIDREDADHFTVKSTAAYNWRDNINGEPDIRSTNTKTLELSFSNKKESLESLRNLYIEQGVPETMANNLAKETFKRAKAQSPEKIVRLDEVRAETIKVSYGGRDALISLADRDKAVEDICSKFGVSKEVSDQILSRAEQHKDAAAALAGTERTLDAAKQNITAHQAQKTDFNQALNRMTDRDVQSVDTMIICSASDPKNYIRCTGEHNGERVVHQYDVYKDGMQQQAADMFGTGGNFTDEHSKDADGKPKQVAVGDGKLTSYWGALKQDMQDKSGIENEQVIIFESQEEFERYQEDAAMVERNQADSLSDTNSINLDTNAPLSDVAASAPEAPELAKPEIPDLPEAPKMEAPKIDIPASRGGR